MAALDELIVPPDPAAAVVTCHRDITPENVRRAADGGIVVLDWENCGPASPAWELAKVLADLSEGAAGPAYRAYRDAGGASRVQGVRAGQRPSGLTCRRPRADRSGVSSGRRRIMRAPAPPSVRSAAFSVPP